MNDQDEASRAYRNFRYMIFSMYSASKMEDPERVRTTIFEVQHVSVFYLLLYIYVH